MPRKPKVDPKAVSTQSDVLENQLTFVPEPVTAPETVIAETAAAPAADPVQKKPRKPREKKAAKKNEPVLKTVVQVGNAEFDISDIAQKTYKAYKSTHKRKIVTDFCIYVKPEENAAYYTINGEGSPEMKIAL